MAKSGRSAQTMNDLLLFYDLPKDIKNEAPTQEIRDLEQGFQPVVCEGKFERALHIDGRLVQHVDR